MAGGGERKRKSDLSPSCEDVRRLSAARLVADGGGIEGIVRLSTKDQSARFSGSAFEKAHPEIAKQFTIEKPAKVTGAIRLTGPASLKKLDEALKADLDTTTKARAHFSAAQAEQTQLRGRTRTSTRTRSTLNPRAVAEAEWHFNRHQAHLVHLLGTDDGIEGCVTWKRRKAAIQPRHNRFTRATPRPVCRMHHRHESHGQRRGLAFHRPYALP